MNKPKNISEEPVFCPDCFASNDCTATSCWSCQCEFANTRVCPYCRNRVDAVKDPCPVCGRLEPAEVSPEDRLAEIKKNFRKSTFCFIVDLVDIALSRL